MRRIIGIDPGILTCGYGLIEETANGKINYLCSGTIYLSSEESLGKRLIILYDRMKEILEMFNPHIASVEKVFFSRTVKTALSIGHARGVVLLCLAEKGLDVREFSPNEVKRAISGYGQADKTQIKYMVKQILGIREALNSHAADALAVALCSVYNAIPF